VLIDRSMLRKAVGRLRDGVRKDVQSVLAPGRLACYIARSEMHPRLFDLTEAQAIVRNRPATTRRRPWRRSRSGSTGRSAFPREQLAELAELGLMGVNVPEQYGGAAAGAVAYTLAMMEIAQGCASTAVTMAVNNLVAETIVRFGPKEQKQRYVPEIASGRFVAASFASRTPRRLRCRSAFAPRPGGTAPST